MHSKDLLDSTVRVLRFVAAIPVVPKASLLRASAVALETAPELQGAEMLKARSVLAYLSQGIVPSQEACESAWREIQAQRERYQMEQLPHEAAAVPSARG